MVGVSDVHPTVSCRRCSWGDEVTEPTGGQSLGGTAGDLMARHEEREHGGSNVTSVDWGAGS